MDKQPEINHSYSPQDEGNKEKDGKDKLETKDAITPHKGGKIENLLSMEILNHYKTHKKEDEVSNASKAS